MDSIRPIRPLPRHKLTIRAWYSAYEQDIEDIVEIVLDSLNKCNPDSRITIKINDNDALEEAIIEHLYQTSYNVERKWP